MSTPATSPPADPAGGDVDLGDLSRRPTAGGPGPLPVAALRALVEAALAGGAVRVHARHDADDSTLAWTAARAGLRREGVLRTARTDAGRRDVALVARLATDPGPDADGLPALVPLFPSSVLSAGLVVRDGADRVLLLRTSYKVPWEVPGGVVEAGEGLRAAAAREGREELGLDLPVGRLLVLDRRGTDGRQPDRLLALLDGGVHDDDLPGRCRFVDGEVLEAAWCTPAEVRSRTGPGLAGRVEAALDRLRTGDQGPALLADGVAEG